jgi:hypothetical protein
MRQIITDHKIAFTLLTLTAVFALTAGVGTLPVAAQDDAAFSGSFSIGFRSVDVGGSENKYREDFNIEDGPRLFNLNLEYLPGGESQFVDRFDLDINNLGGDAFETIHLGARKFGQFNFTYDRRKSNYFYNDTILPHDLADVRLSSGGDFHTFNFDRVRDSAQLDIDISPAAKVYFGFDRFTKEGESTTTLDIQRDEFELDKPINESLNDYRAGFQYAWDKVTLVLEEQFREYDNAYEIFLPGFSLGENATNAATLDFFFLDQPYNLDSNSHIARIVAKPNKRFTVRAMANLQDMELDIEADERQQGTTFTGAPFASSASGEGRIDRDVEIFEVDLSYQINARFAVIGGLWQRSLDQQGEFAFDGTDNLGAWDVETSGGEAGLQCQLTNEWLVTGGVRFESRDVRHDAAEDEPLELDDTETTDQDGFFFNVGWHPAKGIRLSLDYEDFSYDDPFTLASPTDRQRIRLSAKAKLGNGFWINGSYLDQQYENNNSGWDADHSQLALRLGYGEGKLNASVGYSFVDIDRRIAQLTNIGLFPIAYQADADFIDGRLRYKANGRVTFGGDFRLYDNAGSFALDRSDVRAFVELTLKERYLLNLAYRTIDYDEDRFNFDDYDADIVELGIGYRW